MRLWIIGIVLCLTACAEPIGCVHEPLIQISTTPIAAFDGRWLYHTELFEVDPELTLHVRDVDPIEVEWEIGEEDLTVVHENNVVLSFTIEGQYLSGHLASGGQCYSWEDYPPDLLRIDWSMDDTAHRPTLPFDNEGIVESVPLFFPGDDRDYHEIVGTHFFGVDGSLLTQYFVCFSQETSGRCADHGQVVVRHIFERIE